MLYKKITNLLVSPQFLRFLVVGFGVFLIDFALLNIMVEFLHFNIFIKDIIKVEGGLKLILAPMLILYVANVISSAIGFGVNFALNRYWTFGIKTRERMMYQGSKFFFWATLIWFFHNIAMGYLIMNGLSPQISKVLVMCVQVFVSYTVYKFLVFK